MEDLGNFIHSANSKKLDYTVAISNKEAICKILRIDKDCTYSKFKNAIRKNYVNALPTMAKNAEAAKLAKKILTLTGFKVTDFSKWLSKEQIEEISKTIK